jgi:hypothetical protein
MKSKPLILIKDLYPDICKWFTRYLKDRIKRANIEVIDTHAINLSRLIIDRSLQSIFPQASSFDIKVDITALIEQKKQINLAFVECKLSPINLRDLGQILGYSRVAYPLYSFIISPEWISASLVNLFEVFGKYDILGYGSNKRIRIAKWNIARKEIDSETIIPPGPL